MKYVEANLMKDEVVTYRARLHWIAMFWSAVLGGLLGLDGIRAILTAVLSSDKALGPMVGGGIGCLIVAAILLGIGILRMRSAEFAVTNKRVIIKYGVIRTRTLEMFLEKVESVGVNQNIIGRMLGYGTITVRGTGGSVEPFRKVTHAFEFRRQVQEQVSNASSSRVAAA